MWRSNAVMHVTVPYNKVLFYILHFFNKPIGGWIWKCPRIKKDLQEFGCGQGLD
jgi:hypothetical protein